MGKSTTPVYKSIEDGAQQQRIQAARKHCRPIVSRETAVQTVEAMLAKERTKFAWIDDAYRIGDRTVTVETEVVEPSELDWFVLQAKPGLERQAARGLQEIGLRPYLPKQKVWRVVRHPKPGQATKLAVELLLVVGYLFLPARKGKDVKWRAVEAVDGVSCVLRHNDRPQPILNLTAFNEIRRLEEEGFFDQTRDRPPKTKKGDRVRVTSGIFADLTGFVEMAAGERVKVILASLFGSVDMNVDDVEVCG